MALFYQPISISKLYLRVNNSQKILEYLSESEQIRREDFEPVL